MTIRVYRGDAQGRAQVEFVTPSNVERGDKFTLTINRKDITIDTSNVLPEVIGVKAVVDLFINAIGQYNNVIPEWAEISANQGFAADGVTVTHLILTGPTDGKPFTVTASTTDAGQGQVTVTVLVQGVAPKNEKQRVRLGGTPTGGTFTLTFAGQTTAAVAYNASNHTLRDALCDLSNIAGVDEVQTLTSTATGGTFTLTFEGQTTGAIAFNASAATIQTALEALSNVAAGDAVCAGGPLNTTPVTVTFRQALGRSDRTQMTADNSLATGGTVVPSTTTAGVASDVAVVESATSDWLVTFQGAYAETDVPILTGSGNLLTGGGGVSVTTTQAGGVVNEIQDVAHSPSDQGKYRFNGWNTGFIHPANSAAQVQSSLESLPSIGAGNVLVTKTNPGDGGATFRVTFVGALAGANQSEMTIVEATGTITVTTVQNGGLQNEKQQVTLTGGPTGGTFTLTFQGQTTAGIARNADAATVDAALEALANIGAGQVAVTGGPGPSTAWVVEFTGTLASTDVQQMTGSGASLTGGSVNVSVTQEAVQGVNEKQQVAIDSTATGGTFTLTYSGQTTAAIAYNAVAATVDTALEALSNIGVGDVTVTGGPGPATAWVVEFTGALAETNVVAITGDGGGLATAGTQDLVISSSVTPTGPNWIDDPENWEPLGAPVAADILVFDDPNAGDVLYGIENLSTALFAKIIVRASFENKRLGLLDHNGLYFEYRPVELKVQCTEWEIGLGAGGGHSLLRANCQAIQTTVQQFNSGTAPDAKNKATQIRGTHVSNAAEILGGSFSSASDPELVATWAGLKIGGGEDDGTPPDVFLGAGCTLTDIDMDAGTLIANSAIGGTLRQEGGESTVNGTGAIAQLTLLGTAVCHVNTTGAIGGATIVADTAILNLGQDLSAKAFTNPIEIFGGEAKVNDPMKVINPAGTRILDFNQSEVIINGMNLGRNVRVTLGTPA